MTAEDAALLQSARLERAAERLAELLPAAIRSADVAQGRPLQALLAVLASGAAELDAALDAIADAAFVETADAAALEDLGRLVGATPLAPTPQGSGHDLRAYVANALRRRAGKGVAQALEALAADVSGFGVIVVEYFQRLARCEHLLDVRADRPGVADLRAPTGSGAAFGRLPLLPDLRSIARGRGRAHVPHVGVHALRPVAAVFPAPSPDVDARPDALVAALAGAPAAAPWTAAPGFFRLAAQPDGVVRLFNPDTRSAHPEARVGREALPDRLARLPLHRETQALRRGHPVAEENRWFSQDRPFTVFLRRVGGAFERVPPERLRIANLETPPAGRPHAAADGRPIDCVIDPVTGRLAFPEPAAGRADVAEARVAYACATGWPLGAGPQERNSLALPFDIVDAPGVKHFIRVVDATAPPPSGDPPQNLRTVATLAQAAADLDGADASVTRALLILNRCDRESGAGAVLRVRPGLEIHVVAGAWRPRQPRPGLPDDPLRHGHLVRKERKYTLEAPLTLKPARAPAAGERAGVVVLDGLDLAHGLTVASGAVSGLRVRHCVLRAPGAAAVVVADPLAAARLTFERSILGRLDAAGAELTGTLALSDCIVATDGAAGAALDAPALDGDLRNVTVLGATRLKSLSATNALFVEPLDVARTQEGCVRYSYVPPLSRAPRRFQCQPDRARAAARDRKGAPLTPGETAMADLSVRPRFLDVALDEPTLALLHPAASDGLRLGGEGDVEIGAFANAAAGLRMANLRRLFPEFMPFGLEAGVIDDTLSTAAARRRNRP